MYKSRLAVFLLMGLLVCSCKTRSQRELAIEKQKAEVSAAAQKEAEEERKREQAAEEKKRIEQAQVAYDRVLNFYRGVSGSYEGKIQLPENSGTISIVYSTMIPPDTMTGKDRVAEILSQIDAFSFDVEITERSDLTGQVYLYCRLQGIKPNLRLGTMILGCPADGTRTLARSYLNSVDNQKYDEASAREAAARSEAVAEDLLRLRHGKVQFLNTVISSPTGLKLTLGVERVPYSTHQAVPYGTRFTEIERLSFP